MRAYPESNKSFKQLLNEVKDVSLKAYDHQEYPLEELVDEIVEKRDLTRNPLFDVLFRYLLLLSVQQSNLRYLDFLFHYFAV